MTKFNLLLFIQPSKIASDNIKGNRKRNHISPGVESNVTKKIIKIL